MTGSRFAYLCAAALNGALLASCGGGSSSLLVHSPGVSENSLAQRVLPPRGGSFSGGYSGTYSERGCVEPHQGGKFDFVGTGAVSFLHHSVEEGQLYLGIISRTCYRVWKGNVTLTSSKDANNAIKMSLSGNTPCGTLSYAVISGKGKFAKASGSGTVKLTCKTSNKYSDQWSGTLRF